MNSQHYSQHLAYAVIGSRAMHSIPEAVTSLFEEHEVCISKTGVLLHFEPDGSDRFRARESALLSFFATLGEFDFYYVRVGETPLARGNWRNHPFWTHLAVELVTREYARYLDDVAHTSGEAFYSEGRHLKPEDVDFVCSTLTNDEVSPDDELIEHFCAEIGIPSCEAREIIQYRSRFLFAPLDVSNELPIRAIAERH